MSSDKSTPTSGKPNGDASARESPRSYSVVVQGEPKAPISAPASSSAVPRMSKASEDLVATADRIFAETRAVLAKEKEKEGSSPTTVRRPVRQEAPSTSTLSAASQPEVQQSPSPVTTSPIRAPAPSSPALPSPLGAVSHPELMVVTDRVLEGARRVLRREHPASPVSATSPTASSATVSDPLQAPSYEVPSAFYAPLEPLEWAVSASPAKASPKAASSDASIPFDDTSDMVQADSSGNATGSIATPPKTPETSGQAAIRVLREEATATPNILHQHRRQHMSLDGTPVSIVLDATEPEPSSGSFDDPSWHKKAAYRTPTPSDQAETPETTPKKPRMSEGEDETAKEDDSDDVSLTSDDKQAPKPAPSIPRSAIKRPRSPTPERPEERPMLQAVRRSRRVRSAPGTTEAPLISVAERQEIMRHKEHRCPDCDQQCRYVNMNDDVSETEEVVLPPATPRSERAFSPEPMDDMDFDNAAEDAASDAGRPATTEHAPFEPLSPVASPVHRSAGSISRSISPMSTVADSVSEISLAASSRRASPIRDLFCPRCHRDCNCPHVENPNIDFAPAPVRRPRGPRRVTTEEAWARMAHVDDIIGVDLPAPEPVLKESLEVFDAGPLTANRQEQAIRRRTFQLVRYDNGVVVLRGTFSGVSLNSKLMALAAKQPTVIFNDPDDEAVQIAAGRNHVVILTRLGRLLTLGRGKEGQLGASEHPRRYRQSAATVASMRRFTSDGKDVVFEDIKASGNETRAKAKDGPWYVCGQGHKSLLTAIPVVGGL